MNYDKQKSIKIEQERLKLKLKKQKERNAKENKIKLDLRRIKEKQLASLRHKKHLSNDQDKWDKQEADKSDRGRTLKAKEEARINIKRDIKMGLTPKQLRRKYLDPKATVRAMNKDAERETDRMLGRTILNKTKTNLAELVP